MDNYRKHELLIDLAKDLKEYFKQSYGWPNESEILHILSDKLDRYLLVDEQALKDSLVMTPVDNDRFTELVLKAKKYRMSLSVESYISKDELESNKEELEKYLSDYMKKEFCYSLDKKEDK